MSSEPNMAKDFVSFSLFTFCWRFVSICQSISRIPSSELTMFNSPYTMDHCLWFSIFCFWSIFNFLRDVRKHRVRMYTGWYPRMCTDAQCFPSSLVLSVIVGIVVGVRARVVLRERQWMIWTKRIIFSNEYSSNIDDKRLNRCSEMDFRHWTFQ